MAEPRNKNTIALVALAVSIISVGIQFFYQRYSLTITVYDSYYQSGMVKVKTLLQNKGNQDMTVVKANLLVTDYQADTMHIDRFTIKNPESKTEVISFSKHDEDAIILKPKEQVLRINEYSTLDSLLLDANSGKFRDFNANFMLVVVFINKQGNKAIKYFDVGKVYYNSRAKSLKAAFNAKQMTVYSNYSFGL